MGQAAGASTRRLTPPVRQSIEDTMFPEPSARAKDLRERLAAFMDEHVYANEKTYQEQIESGDRWQIPAIMEDLKAKARAAGLWNPFLPGREARAGLTHPEDAPLCEAI